MEHMPPLAGFLGAALLLCLILTAYYAAIAFLSRLFQATVALSRVMGEAIGVAAAWPAEKAIDLLDRWVARGTEWRAQRRIWRAEFKDSLSWQDFQQQLRGKAVRDEAGEAMALLALAEPFPRADLDARFKRVIAGVHPDKGGSPVLARMATDARALILKHKGWKR